MKRKTLIEEAREGILTESLRKVAREEGREEGELLKDIAEGRVIILKNRLREGLSPLAIGRGLKVKVNANIGTSPDYVSMKEELMKLCVAVNAGAHTVMDLSTGGNLNEIRRLIINNSSVPVGTVPIYQVAVELKEEGKGITDMREDHIFEVIRQHAEQGVDFITVHCGVTMESIKRLESDGRVLGIVSRGGALISKWMTCHQRENPLYQYFDRLLELAREYEIVLSLGDGLRPGCLADATDRAQIQELIILGDLTRRAREAGVQVMIEGPGHVPLDQIEANVVMEKELCHGAPFYVLGPLVTDVAPGYDHITSAIGGAFAAMAGADFLCYVTPSEHLRLPTVSDVREGVVASVIAAHAADIARGVKDSRDRDNRMGKARRALDWEEQIRLSLDPEKARRLREDRKPEDEDVCTMCSGFCAIKVSGGK